MKTKQAYLEFEGTPLQFDVVEKESQRHTATATEHPVETGSNTSDHVRDNLATITLDVFMSNTPIVDVNGLWDGRVAGLELKLPAPPLTPGSLAGAVLNPLGAALGLASGFPRTWKAVTMQYDQDVNNVGYVFNALLDWKSRGVVGKVITPYRTYETMYITSVEMNRDASTGDGAPISIELKEIRLVEAKLITAPIPTEPRGVTAKSRGRQPTSFVKDADTKRESFAHRLRRAL